MNVQGAAEVELPELVIGEPAVEDAAAENLADPAGDWLCAWCLSRVANERDRFKFEGQDEFAFLNPQGLRFEIVTFSHTLGCEETGVPTLENTWFPGHAWSFCQCGSCGMHLGWYYAGAHHFAGLIRDRIVRAVCIRN